MKKVFINENELSSLIERVLNEVGGLYKKHKFNQMEDYCVVFMNKTDVKEFKKKINYISGDFNNEIISTPKKYFLSQYYDGSCCFISSFNELSDKVKPVTFKTYKMAEDEISFMVKHSPIIMNKFIPKIVRYNEVKWK